MIIVRVELWSARTGKVTELARMGIDNVGGTHDLRDYRVRTWRGRDSATLTKSMRNETVTRQGEVKQHPSPKLHVWYLVGKALEKLGYAGAK
jgi:hypothetical protein